MKQNWQGGWENRHKALIRKMKRESFTVEDLEKIADVLGVEFNREFILANGDKV